MRLVFGLVLMLGLGLAGFAVLMARDYITTHRAALEAERISHPPAIPTHSVYVVTRAVRYGERLTPEDVRLVPFPIEATPAGVFQTAEALFPRGSQSPRSVLRSMEANEAVLGVKVTGPGVDAGVSARLSPGKRAFAIRVDVSSGVSGFLRPGDRVDVYWSGAIPSPGGQREEVTKLIDSNVRLVAIDQSADEDRPEASVARTVTVEATPRQVAAFAQAQSTGRLSLSLVGAEDQSVAEAVEIDQKDLLGLSEEKRAEVRQARICTIRTRRASEVVEIPIPCSD